MKKSIIVLLLVIVGSYLFASPSLNSRNRSRNYEVASASREIGPANTIDIDFSKDNEQLLDEGRVKFRMAKGITIDRNTSDEQGNRSRGRNAVQSARFTVQKVEYRHSWERFQLFGDIYRFGPTGTRFSKAVQITLPYNAPDSLDEENLFIYYHNKEKQRWERMRRSPKILKIIP